MSDLHPKGWFPAKVVTNALTTSSTGTPQVYVQFETEVGTVSDYFALTEKAAKYTIEKLLAIGWEGNSITELTDQEALAGKDCWVKVKHEAYKSEVRARIAWINPIDQPPTVQSSEEAVAAASAFDAVLQQLQMEKKAEYQAKVAAKPATSHRRTSEPPF